jgi:proteasome component ECM29
LGKYIRQVIGPLDQALTHGGRQVVNTVYEELRAFIERVDQWDQWTGPGEQALAAPMADLAQLLTRERNDVETVRKGRAEAILAFLKLRPTVRTVPDTLGESVRAWRAGERSVMVQRILDEALGLVA